MNELLLILGQATQPAAPRPAPGMLDMFWPLIIIGLIFYFIMLRPQSKERKHREEMLKAIKKNDRVLTTSGIIGVVQMVKDDEVTLKVDESNNTKITFARGAIQRVLSAGPAEASSAPSAPAKK